jgi:phage terminase large subunit-like protein
LASENESLRRVDALYPHPSSSSRQIKAQLQFLEQSQKFGGDGPRSIPRLYDDLTKSTLEPIPANYKRRDGYNPPYFVADELHEHPNANLVDKLRTGMGARREPLGVAITTAGASTSSYCYKERQRAIRIVEGRAEDETRFAFVCGRDPKLKWWSEKALRQANPSLGVTVKLDFIAAEIKAARENPADENSVRRMYLCDWVSQESRWLQLEQWDRAPALTTNMRAGLEGQDCFLGLDLSITRDFSALCALFPREDGTSAALFWIWATERELARLEEKAGIPFGPWTRDGFLRQCEGTEIDYQDVRRVIAEVADTYNVRSMGYDRYQASDLAQQVERELGIECVRVGQSMDQLAEPTAEVEAMVKAKRLRHGDHPVVRWMVDNAAVVTDAHGNRRVVKPKDDAGNVDLDRKVDAVIALVIAVRVRLGAELHFSNEGGPRVLKGIRL